MDTIPRLPRQPKKYFGESQKTLNLRDFSVIGKIRKKWNAAIHKQVLNDKSDKIKKLAEKVMKTDSEEHNIWKAIRDLTG